MGQTSNIIYFFNMKSRTTISILAETYVAIITKQSMINMLYWYFEYKYLSQILENRYISKEQIEISVIMFPITGILFSKS